MSFRRYMMRRRAAPETATGHFVLAYRDARDAPDARSIGELIAYLRGQGAPAETLAAARDVWRGYRAYRNGVDRRAVAVSDTAANAQGRTRDGR